jgi:arginase
LQPGLSIVSLIEAHMELHWDVIGDSLPAGDHEHDLVEELGITHVPAEEVHADATAAAMRARAAAEAAAPAFVVHFDVEMLSFVDAPLADVPEPFGLTRRRSQRSRPS